MESIIANLLMRYEDGALSRRQLVRGIALLAATSAASPALDAQDATKGVRIDHVSVQVTDLPRAVLFYTKVFGLAQVSEDKPNEIVRLGAGGKTLVSLHHKQPTGIVDHFAIGVEKFDKARVTEALKQFNLAPQENIDAGFHIVDPEGMRVQIV
jgi:catechol 2,3-dioxygenase-like lactoylglutathione lyase family enzyme